MEPLRFTDEDVAWFRVGEASDARVRRHAVDLAERLGFGEGRAGEVAIVASELTTNLARHAGGGAVALRRLRAGPAVGIGLLALDEGPGIADLGEARRDGRSSRATLGIGLGAIERLSSASEIYSLPGKGTVVDARIWAVDPPPEASGGPEVAGLVRAMTNEDVCGDAGLALEQDGKRILVLADGLGHGPLAASASRAAIHVAVEDGGASPAALLAAMHRRMRHTRGAAVAVVIVDRAAGVARFAGVGNVAAWIAHEGGRRGMASEPGIVGGQLRKEPREETFELPEAALVVLHSDGLTDRWDLARYPGLRSRSAAVLAGVLLRDAGIRHDDASVLVARAS